MPTTDRSEKRMYANQVKRHKRKLLELADHIHEYSGYLMRTLQSGEPGLGETHAHRIASDVAEVQRRIAALDALHEIASVFDDSPDSSTSEEG